MKYLIFSDSHLTPQFEPAKFNVLKEAIAQADRVIINGDFWEGFSYSFDEFAGSQWSQKLFPLLKKKKAVYLCGNHDKERFADKRMALFSDHQGDRYSFKSGPNTYHVEHGHFFIHFPDLPALLRNILEVTENIVFALLGKTFVRLAYKRFNERLKKKIAGTYKANEFLITGHTHFAEIDLESHYMNEGFINYGIAQYLFIEDGKVTAVEKRY